MLKFFDGQTDRRAEGRTDRVITIGHPPSGGALKNDNKKVRKETKQKKRKEKKKNVKKRNEMKSTEARM